LSFTCRSQITTDSKNLLSVEALTDDIRILKEVLETVHPGLYRYTSKPDMDKLFADTKKQLDKPLTEIEFYKRINPILTAIKDEHTFAVPSDKWWKTQIGQTSYAGSSPAATGKLFPFFIRIIDRRIYIENNLSDSLSINPGDEIVSVNGQSAKEVLDVLLPTISGNGNIESFRLRHLEQFSLSQTYNRFMVHYAIFIGTPEVFEFKIKPRSGTASLYKIPALTSQKIFNNYWRRYSTVNDPKKRKENPLEFKILNDKAGYLRLSAFHTPVWSKYNYSYSTEFRTIFKYIADKHIQNLVVDLRGNEGGNSTIAMEALQYLCKDSYRPYDYHVVNNYRFPALKKYFRDSTAMSNFPDEVFIRQTDGTYRSNPAYKTESWSRPMQPGANNFKGKLYVLTDGATGSAAAIFATLIRVNRKDAVFIGEECGGDMEGPVSGGGTDITLPNSGIKVDIPFIRRVINLNGYQNRKAHGILPDHLVKASPDDLFSNNDPVLQFINGLSK
jgi:C-terminal processing protease CtpA/Prc